MVIDQEMRHHTESVKRKTIQDVGRHGFGDASASKAMRYYFFVGGVIFL